MRCKLLGKRDRKCPIGEFCYCSCLPLPFCPAAWLGFTSAWLCLQHSCNPGTAFKPGLALMFFCCECEDVHLLPRPSATFLFCAGSGIASKSLLACSLVRHFPFLLPSSCGGGHGLQVSPLVPIKNEKYWARNYSL